MKSQSGEESDIDCSIVITVKDAEKYIEQALLSVFAQDSNLRLECICIDDGSVDATAQIIKSIRSPKNVEIRYFYKSIGRAAALNMGVSKSRSKYVAILDADDCFAPDKLAKQLSIIQLGNYDLLATGVELGNANTKYDFWVSASSDEIIEYSLSDFIRGNPICHSSVLMKKDCANYAANRSKQLDLELWLRLVKSDKKIGKLTQKYTMKRIHVQQSFESRDKLNYYLASFRLSVQYAQPKWSYIPELTFRSGKLMFQLLPRNLTYPFKKIFTSRT